MYPVFAYAIQKRIRFVAAPEPRSRLCINIPDETILRRSFTVHRHLSAVAGIAERCGIRPRKGFISFRIELLQCGDCDGLGGNADPCITIADEFFVRQSPTDVEIETIRWVQHLYGDMTAEPRSVYWPSHQHACRIRRIRNTYRRRPEPIPIVDIGATANKKLLFGVSEAFQILRN